MTPQADRLTLAEAADLIRRDYVANQRKSARTLEYPLRHLLTYFGETARLTRITTGAVEAYKAKRLAAKVHPRPSTGSSRPSAAWRRWPGISTASSSRSAWRSWRSATCGPGYFEEAQFETICRHLRPELAALATVAKLTGWRKAELISRQWRHVDFGAGWLRLEPEETKNRDGRMSPLIPELRTILEAQRTRVERLQKATGQVIPWVFCRDDGASVGDFKKAWATACLRAGFFRVEPMLDKAGKPQVDPDGTALTMKKPTKLVHDFRRTAVRSLIRAGIPETVAMKLTGHRTRSVFQRYAIVEEGMLKEAGERLAAGRSLSASGKDRPESGKVAALKR